MENKYKIRNFPGVKLESVGMILTEKEVIDEFGSKHSEDDPNLINGLINSKRIEKAEERIGLFGCQNIDGEHLSISKKDHSKFTKEEIEICEKAINGDMVENDKPIENQYFNREEYGFNVKDDVLTVYPLGTETPNWLSSDEKVSKEAREIVTLTDTGTLTNGWDEKTKHPVDGDELITTQGEDQGGHTYMKVFTKDQMIETVNAWMNNIVATKTNLTIKQHLIMMEIAPMKSFKEHVNRTL